jgi:hypothetical protein
MTPAVALLISATATANLSCFFLPSTTLSPHPSPSNSSRRGFPSHYPYPTMHSPKIGTTLCIIEIVLAFTHISVRCVSNSHSSPKYTTPWTSTLHPTASSS